MNGFTRTLNVTAMLTDNNSGFITVYCENCFASYEFYQKYNIVEPCPFCGYPEIKTKEEYYKSIGIKTEL